jgi:hypothetical protein
MTSDSAGAGGMLPLKDLKETFYEGTVSAVKVATIKHIYHGKYQENAK